MTKDDFRQLREFIQKNYGVKMPDEKKSFLESRLLKRLRALGMSDYTEYCRYLFSEAGHREELARMVDLVTTHKTDFFREPAHFDFLVQKAVPELIRRQGAGVQRKLMVWSAGCSTGEEPYTIAMTLMEFARSYPGLGFDFFILGTDVSEGVLEEAQTAVYTEEQSLPISMELKKRYVLRSRDRSKNLVRIAPELRSRVAFRPLNFLDRDFRLREKMDIIFCRNVMIYFDRATQEALVNRFYSHMNSYGFLFMGHSETLNGLNAPFSPVGPTIYQRL